MQISRIPHYLKKMAQLGPRASFTVVKNRINQHIHERRVRAAAYAGTANHTWNTIASRHGLAADFSSFWEQQKKADLSLVDSLYPDVPADHMLVQADLFEQKIFDLLGSGPLKFSTMPWHIDFRLRSQNPRADCIFDPAMFYKDIVVTPGRGDLAAKDIKIPWELSRCQHFLVLGMAYRHSGDEKYARAFAEQVSDWIQENPYLLGANWACPMDVGIRALNWICAFHFFKQSSAISEQFWQRLVRSLYDHLVYLENNWEIYDGRTSNHYLSDLVGYLYLCHFFRDVSGMAQKFDWCVQEIGREFDKQVFDEGTDYEGSTKYHELVTELFSLAHQLQKFDGVREQKLRCMFDFISWCEGIQVGDNDSGKILYYGMTPALVQKMRNHMPIEGEQHFPRFGISFFKSPLWHVSLRHHAYAKNQPSGHFHNDVGSVTVAVNGIPVIVDPGSYLYTPSAQWRNYFRSAQQHNSFMLAGREPVVLDGRLFALDLPEQGACHTLTTSHTLYGELRAHREVACSDQEFVIEDWWESVQKGDYETVWHFVLSPEIEVVKQGQELVLHQKNKPLMVVSGDLDFTVIDAWYSPEYGRKVPTKKLQAQSMLGVEKKQIRLVR